MKYLNKHLNHQIIIGNDFVFIFVINFIGFNYRKLIIHKKFKLIQKIFDFGIFFNNYLNIILINQENFKEIILF